MNISGIIVGAAVFLSIGICHPAVIKMEYHLGKKKLVDMAGGGTPGCRSILVRPESDRIHHTWRFRLLMLLGDP